jgi:hypothetical protein
MMYHPETDRSTGHSAHRRNPHGSLDESLAAAMPRAFLDDQREDISDEAIGVRFRLHIPAPSDPC